MLSTCLVGHARLVIIVVIKLLFLKIEFAKSIYSPFDYMSFVLQLIGRNDVDSLRTVHINQVNKSIIKNTRKQPDSSASSLMSYNFSRLALKLNTKHYREQLNRVLPIFTRDSMFAYRSLSARVQLGLVHVFIKVHPVHNVRHQPEQSTLATFLDGIRDTCSVGM